MGTQVTNVVDRFDGGTGIPKGPFVTPGLGTLDRGNDVAFGPEGNLYVARLPAPARMTAGSQPAS